MNLLSAIAIGVVVGAGVYLFLSGDLVRIAVGTLLLNNAALLFLMAGGFRTRTAPLYPLASARAVSDPIPQALSLTAIVIGFGVAAFLSKVILSLEQLHGTVDVKVLRRMESEDEAREEPE